MSKCAILGDNTTFDCSEACNSTRLCLMQLQASEPVTRGIITQIAHLAMLLIIYTIMSSPKCFVNFLHIFQIITVSKVKEIDHHCINMIDPD